MENNTLRNIHSSARDYEQISCLYSNNKGKIFDDISIQLLEWFDSNMAAPLGAVLDLLQGDFNSIVFESITSSIQNILQKNGFLSHFGYPQQLDRYNTTIQYQKMKPEDGRYFREYVTTQFINRAELPNMSESVRKKMSEAMLELFVNAQLHSKTQHIYTCGQYYPQRHTIEFCIVDTGVGFSEIFKHRFNKNISSIDAISWAVQDKNTTKVGMTGGIGLAILHEFIEINKGSLQIISGNGFYQYDCASTNTQQLNCSFPGTVVNVTFRTDDPYNYALASKANERSLF